MTAASRRLFFAVWPDDATREHIRQRCEPALQACGGRPVPSAHWHVTLAFLGEVAAEKLAGVQKAASTVPVPRIDLPLDRYGYWAGPRVLWLGPAAVPAGLAGLALQLWAALERIGFVRDRRPFVPHLTLARKVPAAPVLPPPPPLVWPISAMVLVESVHDADRWRYEVIQTFPAGSCTEP